MIDRDVWAAALAIVKRYGAAMQAARRSAPLNCLDIRQIKARRSPPTPCACVNAPLVGVMPRAPLVRHAKLSLLHCFLDSADRIAEFHVIAGETDGEAQTRAGRLLAACAYPA
jgi:hypothetical protein